MRSWAVLLVGLLLLGFSGCSSSLGFGDEDGVGLRGTIGKDGKILAVEPTDGEGKPSN